MPAAPAVVSAAERRRSRPSTFRRRHPPTSFVSCGAATRINSIFAQLCKQQEKHDKINTNLNIQSNTKMVPENFRPEHNGRTNTLYSYIVYYKEK